MCWKENLIKQYPVLLRANAFGFPPGIRVEAGWQPIITTLCRYLDRERSELKRAIAENTIGGCARELDEIKLISTDWPLIIQIKEKYGTLRFYCRHTTPEQQCYIEFAESLSGSVCEYCGKPGITGPSPTNSRWLKTLCDEHRSHI